MGTVSQGVNSCLSEDTQAAEEAAGKLEDRKDWKVKWKGKHHHEAKTSEL